jgi:hypothetical protein
MLDHDYLTMCLLLVIEASASARPELEAAARSVSPDGVRLDVEHPPRWPRGKPERVRATLSESGGCACSLLADDADWEAEHWSMRPEILPYLAATLEAVVARGVEDFVVEALWSGETAASAEQVSVRELLARVRAGRVGTSTRYIVRLSPV